MIQAINKKEAAIYITRCPLQMPLTMAVKSYRCLWS